MPATDANIWISSSATLLQATAIAVTAFFASRGLQTWRKQLLGKRRMEVAEEALVAFRQALEAVKRIRTTPLASLEAEARVTESQDVDAAGRSGFREQLARLVDYDEVWGRLARVQELCVYYLPPEAHAAVNTLWNIVRRIKDVIEYGLCAPPDSLTNQSQRFAMLHDSGADDAVNAQMVEALIKLEGACVPYLR